MGAGAIGCYLGGRLAETGVEMVLVGRAPLTAEIAKHGLRLTDYRGHDAHVSVETATEPVALAACQLVMVTTKGGDTATAAAALAPVLKPGATVVSFQNGVNNPDVLRAALPGVRVLAGMVPFNVLRREGAHFHQGTSGRLAIERSHTATALVAKLRRAGLPTDEHHDMRGVMWGKLLVNLNNSINALAGIPIREMLGQRDYRRVMAACIREGLDACARAGIRPRLQQPLPPRWVPSLLTLPDALFRALARPMLTVDPQARSSMWDDLERGRKTEIEALNGEIVRLAQGLGGAAPVNAKIVELVHEAERGGAREIAAAELRRLVSV
jgi:2-dehydropantoate 2-reductase